MPDRIIEFTVPSGVKSGRADKIFASEFDDISRVRLQKAFEAGQVTFDGITIDKRFKVNRPGLLRAVLEEIEVREGAKAVDIPLDIIYEDESIVVVNKAAGMVTHPGSGTGEDTLVHALLHHTNGQLSSIGAPDRPGIVHRLDKETTGLIVAAKTDRAHHKLVASFSARETYKRYLALVIGTPRKTAGTCDGAIARHRVHRTRMALSAMGKEAKTDWSVEHSFGGQVALVSCVIHTGRTHQIRVHMSGLNHPLLGDTTYGYRPSRLKDIDVPRVMLHSTEFHVQHPERDEEMEFIAPLPADFQGLMDRLTV
ncbi:MULTISPECIES: RluA family pseudouridine synthase [unclassified Lentimonas]|uniref:RluA family pseudouridine synthase n=1 Tax=unclassified Lentimonas TaxID=2630993 RepID=UPI001324E79A|nr:MULTISPECIES: RluA family pseudouridine synthase [unclassified Lentimonas]CAA6679966.1 Ribosomal large subunit pseudouridine synthase D (EC [Lentimonas sp. CC4]CAA6686522.1 Ribosomal large subunit pseudouridine synthase D (EC [Lentimonas sp. CC6]CAA6690389.1 Ribosomal large subunit pseudouridine synthase D (EC [Lentimonas sp. CC19]CAA6693918.1 Ribosomal large subunit pseudouridine synthase D (EC [Lentimonas sp. CC10]CAA7068593.1 Ribosomal large subunit pseudouridine synthase D (EC [Lentimon